MAWHRITGEEVLQVANAYYYFSIQFRENLEIACRLHPHDSKLATLLRGECNTDNLSPWPGVSASGERMNHDEFMRRLLGLQKIRRERYIEGLGGIYLARVRSVGDVARACSISSYEDGGLSRVFTAMLRAPNWCGPGQSAFRFFLEQHILFDTDDEAGHGGLSRHLVPNDGILPLWREFAEMLAATVPRLVNGSTPRHSKGPAVGTGVATAG